MKQTVFKLTIDGQQGSGGDTPGDNPGENPGGTGTVTPEPDTPNNPTPDNPSGQQGGDGQNPTQQSGDGGQQGGEKEQQGGGQQSGGLKGGSPEEQDGEPGQLATPNTGFFANSSDTLGNVLIVTAFLSLFLFIFAIIIAKTKKSRGFRLKRHRFYESRKSLAVLLVVSVLSFLASGIFKSSLATGVVFSTKGTVTATPESGETGVYCGTDEITVSSQTDNGYTVTLVANNGGQMVSGQNRISSIDNWGEIETGHWGFYTYTDGAKDNFEQIPSESRTIVNKNYKTEENDKIKVKYCVKVDDNTKSGTYSSTLSYEVTENSPRYGMVDIEQVDLYADNDDDGILNWEEEEYNLDNNVADSDLDSLSDYDELFVYGTDPLKPDTDEDGVTDYSEIELGFDPLKADSNGNGINDNLESARYTIEGDDVSMSLSGTGSLADASYSIAPARTFLEDASIPRLYEFSLPEGASLSGADVTISYTQVDLNAMTSASSINGPSITGGDLELYYLNEETGDIEAQQATVDTTNKTITAHLTHFSKYFIGVKSKVAKLIDHFKKKARKNLYIAVHNATQDGINIAKEIVDGLDDENKYRYNATYNGSNKSMEFEAIGMSSCSIALFAEDCYYSTPSDTKKYFNSFPKYNSTVDDDFYSTIANAYNGSTYYDSTAGKQYPKYMVLISNGQSSRNYSSVTIENARKKGLIIFVIGIGSNVNREILERVAKGTGGKYYSADDESAVDEIIYNIKTDASFFNEVDIDGDGIADGTLIADSEFIPSEDGFSFHNFGTNMSGAHCRGMSVFSELYYSKRIPLSADAITINRAEGHIHIETFAFNLDDTFFDGYSKQLYDFNFRTNAINKYVFNLGPLQEDRTKWFANAPSNNTLVIANEYRNEIEESGIFEIEEIELTEEEKERDLEWRINTFGFDYDKWEQLKGLDMNKVQLSTIDNSEKQLLNALYSAQEQQFAIPYWTSGTSTIYLASTILNLKTFTSMDANIFIKSLINRIDNKEAVSIGA